MSKTLRPCADCKVAVAVVLLKSKLYCAKCAIDVHYHWNKKHKHQKTRKPTKEEK